MLQEMRKYTKSWISSIFLGALALSFGIWGIADIFRGNTDTSAFTLGSAKVPIEDFQREFHNAIPRTGAALTSDQMKSLGQEVLDQMKVRTALDVETARLGLTASDGRVQREIQSIPAFAGFLGGFDHDTFLRKIQQIGYTEAQFIARSRGDIARSQMIRAVEGGFELPPLYGRAVFAFINEQRAVDYVVLTPAAAPDIKPPGDAVLAAYVKSHPQDFSTPEYRSVSYAAVKVDALAPTITVSDKDIQDEIDSNRAQYITPEKRALEQIQFKTEADAKAAKAAIDGGKSFDAVATARGLKPSEYQLGDVTAADLDPPRAKAFFALGEGKVSDPVKSTFAWVVMRVGKITPGSAKSHDEIKLVLQKRLAAAKISDISNAYTDAVGGGAPIDEAARQAKMNYVHLAGIDAQGLTPDGGKPADPVDPELLAAIFKAEIGEDGDPFTTANGDLYAIKVDGVTPPKLKPLEAVRAQATARWIAGQKTIALRAKAQALVARANQEHSLAGVAQTIGAPVSSSAALNRGTNTGLLTAPVVKAIFDAPGGGAIFAPATSDSFIIARVTGVKHPAPPVGDPQFENGLRQFGTGVAGDITLSLGKGIEQARGVTVNQKMIDNTVGGSGS